MTDGASYCRRSSCRKTVSKFVNLLQPRKSYLSVPISLFRYASELSQSLRNGFKRPLCTVPHPTTLLLFSKHLFNPLFCNKVSPCPETVCMHGSDCGRSSSFGCRQVLNGSCSPPSRSSLFALAPVAPATTVFSPTLHLLYPTHPSSPPRANLVPKARPSRRVMVSLKTWRPSSRNSW